LALANFGPPLEIKRIEALFCSMGTAIGDILNKEEISLDFLDGRLVGVDSFNTLYQFLSSIRGRDGSPLMDSRGRVTSHLTGLLYRTTNLIEKGIKPVFVFDGKPHKLKAETREKRREIRTAAEKKFEKAKEEGDDEAARKFGRQSSKLTGEMIEETKKLVGLMGLTVVQAPSEGEAQVASMVAKGDLYGCVSQDFDALLFGTPLLFRNITISGKRKAPGKNYYYDVKPEKIDLQKNVRELGIDRKKLVWMGILVGTDFNKKFPKVGAKTALKLVQKFDSFEDIVKKTGHKPDFDYKEIEDLFLKPESTGDYKIEFGKPDREKIFELMVEEHDFSKERVESVLDRLCSKAEETSTQSRLGQWG
jgi:flap endonuclease-1